VSVSAFTLEDDALIGGSPFLDELRSCGLPIAREPAPPPVRIFAHEALAGEPTVDAAVEADAAEWLALRRSRSERDSRAGATGARPPAVFAVSSVERYLECPFKYFAQHVLKLDEERPDESGLTPQERGQFLHAVFEEFFDGWRAAGYGAISAANLADALARFEDVAEATLATLPEGDRALERTYLLGSAAAPGLAERAFAFEIEHGVEVVDRLLEHALEGIFTFSGPDGSRSVALRAKADRIDLLADGTLRVVDYKLGKAPKPARALQLPVYGLCAEQQLEGHRGRSWTLGRAGYVAFREKNAFVPLGGPGNNLEKALADGQQRLLAAIDGIEAGRFPVEPDEPWLCTRCGFAVVCRKDYVGDE
jgi:RecB family exonuclease